MYRFNILLFIIMLSGMIMPTIPSFTKEEQTQEPQIRHMASFRQWRNSDLVAFHSDFLRSSLQLADSQFSDNHMKQMQGRYNNFLSMLLWTWFQEGIDWESLDMSGLQKLEWVVKTNKTIYQPGEPVGFRVFLRNISMQEVKLWGMELRSGFMLNSMMINRIWKDNKQDIFLTQFGSVRYNDVGIGDGSRPWRGGTDLKPGDMVQMYPPFQTLNPCYDLSEPGEYELTFYTRNFLGSDDEQIGEYPKPCTIRFKIEGNTNWLDSHVVWPEEDK